MSTLTYPQTGVAEAEAVTPRRGFWHRLYEGMVMAQERRAEREIARYLEAHGGLLTDDMERQVMERLTGKAKRPL